MTGRTGPQSGGDGFVAAVDLGGTKIDAVIADRAGRVAAETIVETDGRGGVAVCDQIGAVVATLCRQAGIPPTRLAALSVGSPGAIDRATGRLAFAPNIPGFDRIDVAAALKTATGLDAVIENDVRMAALGELWAGRGRGLDDFAFMSLGTGIGLGLVCGGQLLEGARGAAGEIAYLPLGSNPFEPESLHQGALERVVGSRGIMQRYAARGGAAGSVRGMFDRLSTGEEAAGETLKELAELATLAVLTVACMVDPKLVVLGGSIGVRPELVEAVRSRLAECAASPVAVAGSALGSRAGIHGAIAIALLAAGRHWDGGRLRLADLAPPPRSVA